MKARLIVFDASLSYDEHVTEVVSQCTASLCQIYRVKHILDRKSLLMAINALVFTKLYYCSTVWENTSKGNVKKLQSIQNFAARIVMVPIKLDHITPSLKQLLLPSLALSRRLEGKTLFHELLSNQSSCAMTWK